jgi:hypothetical protein
MDRLLPSTLFASLALRGPQQPQAKMAVSAAALRAFGSKQASCPFVSSRFHLAGQARHHFGWVRHTLVSIAARNWTCSWVAKEARRRAGLKMKIEVLEGPKRGQQWQA